MPVERDSWKPVLLKLLEILAKNRDCGKEKILLIPHAFLALLHEQCEIHEFKSILKSYLLLNDNQLHTFGIDYNIQDVDLFKLLIIHGYTQVNRKEIYNEEICKLSFEVLYQNCIRYTKYTYLAYKILQTWLQRTSEINFWKNNDPKLEKKLKSLIYSNWDNSIKEVSKQNCTSVFNQYLRIMDRKYDGFLHSIFQDCLDNMSWLNETKYVILTEICNVWDNIKTITGRDFILRTFTCLEKNYLRNSGTKLYNIISNKLSDEQWKDTFGCAISHVILQWGYDPKKNRQALQLLCTQWLEPIIKKRRSILPYLWDLSNEVPDILFRSHLERIASQTGVRLQGAETIETFIDHCDECLRLNSFATHCQKHIYFEVNDLANYFLTVRHFLFYNANTSSTFLRRGIIKYFKIFFLNLLKSCNVQQYYNDKVFFFFEWLHKFLLDCFEIGSCYQRKIFGVKLYEIILFYTNERVINYEIRTDSRYKEDLVNGFKINQRLGDFGEWMFTNKTSLLWLFKLTLDPATDVRDISAGIILEHFQSNSLNDSEKRVLLYTAITKCNSSKFHETESGSTLIKILSKWLPLGEINITETDYSSKESDEFYTSLTMHTKYIEYLIEEAHNQLGNVKEDILKAAMQNSPFHGTLTAILNVGFRNESKTELVTPEFAENLLKLLEDAVSFFLLLLSSESRNSELSSSFSEMGLAIDKTVKDSELCDKYDDVVLSPAHQVVITCIWISLKVSCELASEIGMLTYSYDMVERSANLVTSVLMKCRYKGAIEAAGVAIGYLTRKLVNVKGYSHLPEEWLNHLTSDHKINPNLTRRGAGLSIMFHQIVANDNRHGKPLVHITIKSLLNFLENTEDSKSFEEGATSCLSIEDKSESYEDLPRVKHLHFIQRLVADSDLHAQVVPYLDRITMVCFKNLQSQIWTIRNASLQLFGAVTPRIAGQHNGDEALDFGNGYSIDHFITHYPELANYILLKLETAVPSNNRLDATLISHSALVPSLTLLCRMSTSGSDFIGYSSKTYITKIKKYLELLFGSPIGNVRILAAKAYAALVAFPQITVEREKLKLVVQKFKNFNYTHGYSCAIKYVSDKFQVENDIANSYNVEFTTCGKEHDHLQLSTNSMVNSCSAQDDSQLSRSRRNETEILSEITSRVSQVEKFWNDLYHNEVRSKLCYVTESMYLVAFENSKTTSHIYLFKEIGAEIDVVLKTQKNRAGFGEFINISTRFYIDYINRTNNIDEEIIRRILNSQCTDQAVTLLNNLKHSTPVQYIILDYIVQTFPECDEALLDAAIRYLNESIRTCSTLFTINVETRNKIHRLLQRIGKDRKYCKLEPFFNILLNTVEFNGELMDEMVDYCCSKVLDDDEIVRKLAAECLPCLLLNFTKTKNNNKLKILKLCLAFLKDEVSEIKESIRTSLVNFFQAHFTKYTASPFDEILYFYIFDAILTNKTSCAIFSEVEILEFFLTCLTSINCTKDSKALVESPFDHEDDATSAEETKLLNIIYFSILRLEKYKVLKNNVTLGNSIIPTNCCDVVEAKHELHNKIDVDFSDLKTILNLSFTDYMVTKVTFIHELCNLVLESAEE